MSIVKQASRSFAGGEISPDLAGRMDLAKYATGLSLCRNFYAMAHGPVTRRPGFEFVTEAKNSTLPVRYIPFSFNATQTAVLEFGHEYIRFHIDGGTVVEDAVAVSSIAGSTVNTSAAHGYATGDWVYMGGRPLKVTVVDTDTFTVKDLWGASVTPTGTTAQRVYTIASPYKHYDLFDLHFTQNSDILTVVHPSYAARELKRFGATNWTLSVISFAPTIDRPPGLTVTRTYVDTDGYTSRQEYCVSAVGTDGVSESLPGAARSTTNDLTRQGNFNTLEWNGVDGSVRYNAYKRTGGIFGYIGQTQPQTGTTVDILSAIRGTVLSKSKTVTVTTDGAHGFTTGNNVLIEGTGVESINGYWTITVVDSDTFTFQTAKEGYNVSSTGTVSIPELSLVDDNIQPDLSQTPPDEIIKLNEEAGEYPAAATYFEQRRWFAGSDDKPQVIVATRSGTETNLMSSIPSRDSDAIEMRVASMQNNRILHLVPLVDLIAFTGGGEFRIYADSAPAVTPTSITIKPQGYTGASNVQPVVTSGSILYVQAQGSHVREMAFGGEAANYGYRSIDISVMAPHRFDGYAITQLAYSRAPDPILWAVRDDGVLLGMTYMPEHQVSAWHAHDTDGQIESVCVVAENNEDVLYIGVIREVDGRTVRYLERLRTRLFTDLADAFFVDSGLTYSGTTTSTITGLWHLEGCEVDVLADGAVQTRKTVNNGQITLDTAASQVHVGLPITADVRTLPLAVESQMALGQGAPKNVNKVYLRVRQSSVVKAGPAFDRLREYPARDVSDNYGSPPALRDGELALSIDPSWKQEGSVCVRQDLPLPLTLLSLTLEVQVGG